MQNRDRSAVNFHFREAVGIDNISTCAEERTERELVGHSDSIHDDQHAVAAHASNCEALETPSRSGSAN